MEYDYQESDELTPQEKETVIRFDKTMDTIIVCSREGSIMRALLNHDLAEVIVKDTEGSTLYGVTAKLPIGCLSIGSKGRSSTRHSRIVTVPANENTE